MLISFVRSPKNQVINFFNFTVKLVNILKNAYEIKYSEKPDYTWYIKQFK